MWIGSKDVEVNSTMGTIDSEERFGIHTLLYKEPVYKEPTYRRTKYFRNLYYKWKKTQEIFNLKNVYNCN